MSAEAAATTPPQLPTQHPSNFQVPVLFFFLKFVRSVGWASFRRGCRPNLAAGQRGKLKSIRILLHFGDMLKRIAHMAISKKNPHNVATLRLSVWLFFSFFLLLG